MHKVISTSTTSIIGELAPSYTYGFSVAAHTIAPGPYSTTVYITMPEDGKKAFLEKNCKPMHYCFFGVELV